MGHARPVPGTMLSIFHNPSRTLLSHELCNIETFYGKIKLKFRKKLLETMQITFDTRIQIAKTSPFPMFKHLAEVFQAFVRLCL